ncbi:unnamed protein product, partial [Brenthis ino]
MDGATIAKLRGSSQRRELHRFRLGILRIEMARLHIVTQNFNSNSLRCMRASLNFREHFPLDKLFDKQKTSHFILVPSVNRKDGKEPESFASAN